MLAFDPEGRPSAAEALRGPFLNRFCDAELVPPPPARPWTLQALQALHGAGSGTVERDECLLPDADEMGAPLISVKLAPPFDGLELRGIALAPSEAQPQSRRLVYVAAAPAVSSADASSGSADATSGSPPNMLRVGDVLLSVGPIDVREWEIDRVLELLQCWSAPIAKLTFERSAWGEAEGRSLPEAMPSFT